LAQKYEKKSGVSCFETGSVVNLQREFLNGFVLSITSFGNFSFNHCKNN